MVRVSPTLTGDCLDAATVSPLQRVLVVRVAAVAEALAATGVCGGALHAAVNSTAASPVASRWRGLIEVCNDPLP